MGMRPSDYEASVPSSTVEPLDTPDLVKNRIVPLAGVSKHHKRRPSDPEDLRSIARFLAAPSPSDVSTWELQIVDTISALPSLL